MLCLLGTSNGRFEDTAVVFVNGKCHWEDGLVALRKEGSFGGGKSCWTFGDCLFHPTSAIDFVVTSSLVVAVLFKNKIFFGSHCVSSS